MAAIGKQPGAASHMGRKDIASYLLERGARIDLFAAAMLGKFEIVKAMLSDDPKLKEALGPHTKAGGDEAKAVVEFLQSLG